MPQNADDLSLLYIFTGSFFLMFAYMLRSGWDGSLRGWGNRMEFEGIRALATTGVYELPERHAWDSPAARATLTGEPPLKHKPTPRRDSAAASASGHSATVDVEAPAPRPAPRTRRARPAAPAPPFASKAAEAAALGRAPPPPRSPKPPPPRGPPPPSALPSPGRAGGWGASQIRDEVAGHLARLPPAQAAPFRSRLAVAKTVDALADLNADVQDLVDVPVARRR